MKRNIIDGFLQPKSFINMHQGLYATYLIVTVMASIFLPGCNKLVEVDTPSTSLSGENIYSSDETAISVVSDLYVEINKESGFASGYNGISFKSGLSSDEFFAISNTLGSPLIGFYTNALTNLSNATPWEGLYEIILKTNAALEGINDAALLTPTIKKQLLGECKFVRAFLYFYVVTLYGDAPLVTSTSYTTNKNLARSPASQVWDLILSDLAGADSLLSENYLDKTLNNASLERVRPTQWAAKALQARTQLYLGNWEKAENYSSEIISASDKLELDSLGGVFLRNSKEAIWQLPPTGYFSNTNDAGIFILTAAPYGKPYLSTSLYNAFENNDQRKEEWIGSFNDGTTTYHFPFKYKILSSTEEPVEYQTIFRLAEQYLIRSEARAWLDKFTEAKADLDIIRARADLPGAPITTDKTVLLNQILHERRLELFSEWGHRWLDLKRTNAIDSVMTIAVPAKEIGASWKPYQALYPLPLYDLQANTYLKQNPGY